MNFIGRKEELNTLEKEFRRDGSFVVIYGRRRIGKTTLIKEFIKDKQAFYFLATEEVESQSMKRLAGVVARVTGNSMLQRVTFTDWLDLFREIANYRPEEKKVLVIDEFPYLVKTNAAFPSILQNAWDEILKDSNVTADKMCRSYAIPPFNLPLMEKSIHPVNRASDFPYPHKRRFFLISAIITDS